MIVDSAHTAEEEMQHIPVVSIPSIIDTVDALLSMLLAGVPAQVRLDMPSSSKVELKHR